MTSSFDWNQFEDAPQSKSSSSPDFDWDAFENVPEKKETTSFLKKPSESKVPGMKRTIGRAGKVVGSTILGLPGDIAEIGTDIGRWGASKITGKEFPKSKFSDLPTSQEITGGIEKAFPSVAPQNEQEKEWEDQLALITSLALPGPKGTLKVKDPRALKSLYQAGKRLGLSEKDLAPLFLKEWNQKILGKLASKSSEAAKELQSSKAAIGSLYEPLKERGANLGPLKPWISKTFGSQLQSFRKGLEKTLSASPEKQSMIGFVEKAEKKLSDPNVTPEHLINFYQDINNAVNWKAIDGGKKVLSEVKDYVKGALFHSDPSLMKDFNRVNELHTKVQSVIRSMGRKKVDSFIEYAPYSAAAYSLLTGDLEGAAKKAIFIGGAKKAASKIATKMLTDPKWQNLYNKGLTILKNNSPKMSRILLQEIKRKTKEDLPDEYEQIDWDQLSSNPLTTNPSES